MSVSNESEKAEAAPTTPQHELTLRIQLLDYLFERGHRITKPLIDAAAHFAYSYGTALYEQGKLKGQHRGNDLTTEDSTPTRSDLESPLSAPTNTDELKDILQSLYDNGTGIDNNLPVYDPETAEKEVARLIALKQREELEQARTNHAIHSYSETDESLRENRKMEEYLDKRIAKLNTIIEGEK